ncbi:hypothetical protein, partial [Cyanobium sp. A2C-AMD]|uniref:hypothetical protein n=1 Tax=Cyanobium sp. A2C-AMD TaxID=2823695 RepID=UPI0020CDE605
THKQKDDQQINTEKTNVLRVALSNTAPLATHATRSQITELATAGGYTSGGISVGTITGAQTSGTFKLTGGTDPVFTGSGVGFTARYAILFNDTPTSPADPLIGYWDYGSSVTIGDGETLTIDLDQTNGILTLA